jgi:hypothetical protein
MTKHKPKHRPRPRRFLDKIPEAVEKSGEKNLRENIVSNVTDAMLDALNQHIQNHDLTFEEALHAIDIVRLSVIAKYINYRIDARLEELTQYADKERRMYA